MFRVGIAYGVAAWLLIQVTDIVVPTLDLPEWIGKATIFFPRRGRTEEHRRTQEGGGSTGGGGGRRRKEGRRENQRRRSN